MGQLSLQSESNPLMLGAWPADGACIGLKKARWIKAGHIKEAMHISKKIKSKESEETDRNRRLL
jgi:hypothetical protein